MYELNTKIADKKLSILISAFLFILFIMPAALFARDVEAQGQGTNAESSEQEKKEDEKTLNVLGKGIEDLQKKVDVAMKKFSERQKKYTGPVNFAMRQKVKDTKEKYCKDNKDSCYVVPLDMGLTNRIGFRNRRASYEESAVLIFDGSSASQIKYVYEQTNVQSLVSRGRVVSNEKVGSGKDALFDIKVISQEGASSRTDTLNDYQKSHRKRKVLMMYRDFLLRLIRTLDNDEQSYFAQDEYEVNRSLDLGAGN